MLFFNQHNEFASQEELDAMIEWNKNNPTPDMNWDQLMAQEPAIQELLNPIAATPEGYKPTVDCTPECVNEYGVSYVWVCQYFDHISIYSASELEYHATLTEARITFDGIDKSMSYADGSRVAYIVEDWSQVYYDPTLDLGICHSVEARVITTDTTPATPVAIVPSFVEGQSAIVRSDFAKLYPMSAPYALIQWGNGGMGYGWYLTTQPIDAKRIPVTLYWDNGKFIPSARFEQLPYEPTKVQYFPTPSQIEHLDAQLEYWNARRYAAELAGDGDEEEFCSLFVLTVQSLLFV